MISFDDVAVPGEGGITVDAPPPIDRPDVFVEVKEAGVDSSFDSGDAIANPSACKAHGDGKYCGGDMITWPADRKDDLVTCKASVVSSVRYCAAGVGCIANIAGYPDECDECGKKADGIYCGRDMPGWDAKNANQRVRCGSGREVGLLLCGGAGCKSNGAASVCQ